MSLLIREAVEDDLPQVVDLWRACDLLAPYNDPVADFAFARAGENSTVLIAQEDTGRVIGSVMVGHDGHRGWLYYVACAPGDQRRGIGRALVETAEQWLQARHVRKVQLMVREANVAVLAFYERLGFEDMPRVLMSKWLSGPG